MDAYFNLFIVIVVYLIAEVSKKIMVARKKEKYRDLLPHICLVIGAIIAIILLYVYPSALSENITDPIQAFICGALSGVAATGSNQLFSRTVKFRNTISSSFTYDDDYTTEVEINENEVTNEYSGSECCNDSNNDGC